MTCSAPARYCPCREHRAQRQREYRELVARREGRTLRSTRGRPRKLDADRKITATMEWSEANGGPHGYHSTLDADYLVFPTSLSHLQAVMSST